MIHRVTMPLSYGTSRLTERERIRRACSPNGSFSPHSTPIERPWIDTTIYSTTRPGDIRTSTPPSGAMAFQVQCPVGTTTGVASLHLPSHLGYDGSSSLVNNIRSRFGSASHFDVIYFTGGGYGNTELRAASQYSPIMNREHECWGYRCLSGFIDANVSIVLLTFAYEIDLYHASFSYNRVIAHSPTIAEPRIFYPPLATKTNTAAPRDIDVLVVGARHPFVYPIRTRIGDMIQKGLIKNSLVHQHPGYYFENNTVEQTEAQMHLYAAVLRRAKIVVVDSSRYGYALSKYTEVPLSGALAMGDIPAEREDEFRSFMVEISMSMTDAQIISTIKYWITREEERQARANLGQQIVLNAYTFDHSIDRSLQAVLRYRRKQYGIMHSYPYSVRCFPLDNTMLRGPTANHWCPAGKSGALPRSLCRCNKTKINYFDDELDLDDWKGQGIDVNATDPQVFSIPTSLLQGCYPRPSVIDLASRSSSASHCECEHPAGDWRVHKSCYVSSSALTISRYLAHLYARKRSAKT